MSNKTYRCPTCKQCWPDDSRFQECPECSTPERWFKCWHKNVGSADTVMPLAEALQAKAYIDFDEFYAKKCLHEHETAIARLSTADPLYVGDIVDFG